MIERSNRETIARLGGVGVATLARSRAPTRSCWPAAGAELPLETGWRVRSLRAGGLTARPSELASRSVTRRAVLCLAAVASLAPLAWPGLAHANAYRAVLPPINARAQSRRASSPAAALGARSRTRTPTARSTSPTSPTRSRPRSSPGPAACSCRRRFAAARSRPAARAAAVPSPAGGSAPGPVDRGHRIGDPGADRPDGPDRPGRPGSPAWAPALAAIAAAGIRAGPPPARHGLGEAGYRLSAILADFTDWRKSSRRRSSA